jgi:hypothetical protein
MCRFKSLKPHHMDKKFKTKLNADNFLLYRFPGMFVNGTGELGVFVGIACADANGRFESWYGCI